MFDFLDPLSDVISKEIKREALQELSEHLSRRPHMPESAVPEIVRMVLAPPRGTLAAPHAACRWGGICSGRCRRG